MSNEVSKSRRKNIHKRKTDTQRIKFYNYIFLTCISYNSVAWKQNEPIPTTEIIEIFILIEKKG